MSSPHLQRQYSKLYHHYQSGTSTSQTTLSDIADVLFCSKRNARNVLGKLSELTWIKWSPVTGRGKKSQLQFLRSTDENSEQIARDYIAKGRLEMALSALSNDSEKLSGLLRDHMGGKAINGKQVLRIPYYRSFPVLSPTSVLKRTERHLVRYILEGLTRIDEEKGEVIAAISHHWQQLDQLTWRFYLRTNVYFHNGKRVSIDDIEWSLEKIRQYSAFAHIEKIEVIASDVIDIHLIYPDHSLPMLMAQNKATITPENEPLSKSLPIGTGSFKVLKNTHEQLILEAFSDYYGERPILDRIEFWTVPNMPSTYLYPSDEKQQITGLNFTPKSHTLDNGSLYLLLNHTQVLGEKPQWRDYLSQLLNSLNVFQAMEHNNHSYRYAAAYGLLPTWAHVPYLTHQHKPHDLKEVSLAYDPQHPMHPTLIAAIKKLLQDVCITVKEIQYSPDKNTTHVVTADLILESFSVTNPVNISMVTWFYQYDHIKRVMSENSFMQFANLIKRWRQQESENIADQIGQRLVSKQHIIPLVHPWNGIKDSEGLCAAQANKIGWFDFNKVWIKRVLD